MKIKIKIKNISFLKQKTKAYLRYRWRAKNAHGLHSPFLFDLYYKVFYHKKKFFNSKRLFFLAKKDQILINFLNYLEISAVDYIGTDFSVFKDKIQNFVKADCTCLDKKNLFLAQKNEKKIKKILFLDEKNLSLDLMSLDLNLYSGVVFQNPWLNQEWMNFFRQKNQFSVTIDSFYWGFALVRPQRKQHFVIKT